MSIQSIRARIHIAVALLTLLTACDWILNYQDDPNYCPGSPHDNCLNEGQISCESDRDCAGDTAVCDSSPGPMTCVQCTPARNEACGGATPACIDNACRPCTTHGQCDSQVCLIDDGGTCAAPGDVAYVDPAGTDNGSCTILTPCTKIGSALATARPYVKLAGTLDEAVVIDDQDVTLLGERGARLTRTQNGLILEIKGTSQVRISDLEISGGSGAQGIGISIPSGSSVSLSVTRSTISGNQGGGIIASGAALGVSRSTISENTGGGISVSGVGAVFDLTNNFIFRNGHEDHSPFGGVSLDVATAGSSRFEFNTLTDNRAATGGTRSGGIICDIVGFTAPNNIVARNRVGTSTTAVNAQTLGGCTYPSSRVQSDVAALGFGSPDTGPYDYKLTEGSSAIDHATAASPVVLDHEGDARPQGSGKDIGADELRR